MHDGIHPVSRTRGFGFAAVFLAGIVSAVATGGGDGEPDLPTTVPGTEYFQLAAEDLNSDQLRDLIALSSTPGSAGSEETRLDLLIRDPNDPGSFELNTDQPTGDVAGAVLVADLDLDSRPDVAVTEPATDILLVLRLFDEATGRFGSGISYATGERPGAMALADLDLDGLSDLVIATSTGVMARIQDSNFPGRFSNQQTIDASLDSTAGGATGLSTLVAEDVSGDGLVDVVAARADGVRLYDQDRAVPGSFLPARLLPFPTPPEAIAAADLNHDGQIDLVGGGRGFLTLLLQETGNPGIFLPDITVSTESDATVRFVQITDLNADGLPDVIAGNAAAAGTANRLQVFLQTGPAFGLALDAGYEIPDAAALASVLRGVAVADLNGDNLPDVVVSQKQLLVFLNDAAQPGKLTEAVQISGDKGVPLP